MSRLRAMGNPSRWSTFLPDILPALMVAPDRGRDHRRSRVVVPGARATAALACWGRMLNVAQRWKAIWPGLAIFLVVHFAVTACATRSIRGSGERS
jgi:hypothetical protein